MNSRNRLLQMACLVLVMSFLVGCGASQATLTPLPEETSFPEPTQAPPEPTETPPEPTATQVEPTATPIPPTATLTARPLTATPTQVFTLVTSAEEIVGTWFKGDVLCIRIYEDGTFNKAWSLDELDSHPYAVSKFWFEGTQMFIEEISVSGVPSCGKKTGIYEIRLLEDDNIQISTIKDQCSHRVTSTRGIFQPVH